MQACGCRKPRPAHATWVYSWISPPRRSTRRTRTSAAGAGGGTAPCGGAWPSAPVGPMRVAGSARGAVPAFRRARFPGPPSEPGVPVSRHRALHEARYQQTVALTLGSAVPGLDCQVGHRYSPAAPALPTRPAASLCPFALWPAFPDLRLLRALRHDPPPTADDAPARRTKAGRAATGRFPRSPPPGRRGRCPAIPRQPRQGYAAALPPGLLTGHYKPAAESLAATATGVHC